MKFKKFNLDESLFDAPAMITDTPAIVDLVIDDDFSDPEGQPSSEVVEPATPATPMNNGVAGQIHKAIEDEFKTISMYNDLVISIDSIGCEHPEDIKKVISDIAREENVHVGQLQELLKLLDPNASAIAEGNVEAKEVIDAPIAPLAVTSVDNSDLSDNYVSDVCTLSDVDDIM